VKIARYKNRRFAAESVDKLFIKLISIAERDPAISEVATIAAKTKAQQRAIEDSAAIAALAASQKSSFKILTF